MRIDVLSVLTAGMPELVRVYPQPACPQLVPLPGQFDYRPTVQAWSAAPMAPAPPRPGVTVMVGPVRFEGLTPGEAFFFAAGAGVLRRL